MQTDDADDMLPQEPCPASFDHMARALESWGQPPKRDGEAVPLWSGRIISVKMTEATDRTVCVQGDDWRMPQTWDEMQARLERMAGATW
jgi:hypothetical protein